MNADLQQVWSALAPYTDTPGLLHICSTTDWTGRTFETVAEGIELAAKYVGELDETGVAGIYHRGTTLRQRLAPGERGKADQSHSWLAIRLDLDHGKEGYAPNADTVREIVEDSPLPEVTQWVDSGHGLYPVWAFAEPVDDSPAMRDLVRDVHACAEAAFAQLLYDIDPGVTDAARVWRIPGTVNRKREPISCQVVDVTGRVYHPGELRQLVPWTVRGTESTQSSSARPDGERRFTLEQARTYVERYSGGRLRTAREGAINVTLNDAACVIGHFIPAFVTEPDARRYLLDALAQTAYDGKTWKAGPTITSGLRKGMDEPYTRVDENPTEGGDAEQESAAETPAQRRTRLIAERMERLEIDDEARRAVSAARREPLQVLDSDSFLDAEPLEYLVPSMFYRASTSKVYGPPGGTKSFLLLDLALSMATGRVWRDVSLDRSRVHFVMAEGQSANQLRTLAWLMHHEVDRDELRGWFTAIPQGVLLTPEGIDTYLEQVKADQPALIILDTKNAMMDGEENSASDSAIMVRAMRALRDEASGATVVLVDHTGLGDQSRGRGSNAVLAAMDTEVRVSRENGVGVAEVTRDKSAEPGMRWAYRLHAVDEVPRREGISPPAVCVPTDAPKVAVEDDTEWTSVDVRGDILDAIKDARGDGMRGRRAAVDVSRYFLHVSRTRGEVFRSRADVVQALMAEGRGKARMWSRQQATEGWDIVRSAGLIEPETEKTGVIGRHVWVGLPQGSDQHGDSGGRS